jgi:N-acetylgalactosamine-N,N'-diacetylbacillosaminyl-diphospho-undecaprenol 4-alpha-N-acetylgalactosaminyltransferase
MKKEKIAITALSMGSGGAEKVISLLLPQLAELFSVTLILFTKNDHFKIPEGINVHYLTSAKKQSLVDKITDYPKIFVRFYRIIKQQKISTSISFLTRPNLLNCVLKICIPKVKVIISERCYPSIAYASTKWRYQLYKFLLPILYNKADTLFANSTSIADDLNKNFSIRKKVHTIYNPVAYSENIPIKNFNPPNSLKIVSVGAMTPIKNQKLIIEALQLAKGNFELTYIGDGILKEELIHQSKELPNTRFTGKIKNVNEELLNHDVFVLSSNSEGFPNALIEAMAAGKTVISTNCLSGPLEILNKNKQISLRNGEFYHGQYGILINTNDSLALKNAINYLYNNPKALENYSKLSRARAKDFNIETTIQQFTNLIIE